MGITPNKDISAQKKISSKQNINKISPKKGWLALSPLLVFLGLYFASSIVAHDSYKVPISAAFLLASAYGIIISKTFLFPAP